MDARQIIDFAADDNAKDMREALYASIYDRVTNAIEAQKQEIAHSLMGAPVAEAKKDDDESEDKADEKEDKKEGESKETEHEEDEDEKEDKAMIKKMVKKDALKSA